jgi:putative inorganic carbon (HCO3(-)) transporter
MDGRRTYLMANVDRSTLLAVAVAVIAGILMVAVHPVAPVVIAVAIAVGIFLVRSPFVMMVMFVAVLFIRPAELFPVLDPLKLGKLTALGALGLFVLSKFVRRDTSWAKSTHNFLMVWLVIAVLISSFFGTWPGESLRYFTEVFVKIIILYVLVVNMVNTRERAISFQISLSCLTGFLGAYALWMKFTGQAMVEGSRAGGVGMLGDPNDLALTLLVATPFLLGACMETSGRVRRRFLFLLVLTAGGIIATQSRGGLIGLAVGLYFVLRHRIKSRAVVLVVAAVMLAGLALAAGVGDRRGLESQGLDESAEGRLAAWRAGGRMLRAHPAFGVGYEQFPYNFLAYADSFPTGKKIMAAHNSYVKAFAEVGFVGATPFMLLILISIIASIRLWNYSKTLPPGIERALLMGNVGNLMAVLTAAFFLSQTWMWFIYILFAQVAVLRRLYHVDHILGLSGDGLYYDGGPDAPSVGATEPNTATDSTTATATA